MFDRLRPIGEGGGCGGKRRHSLCARAAVFGLIAGVVGGGADVARSDADPVLLAAGDIADCAEPGDEATARVLDNHAGTIITLGDNAYEDGTAQDFQACYQPSWGRHKSRTRPSPGNHDYNTSGAAGYFGYFGAAAGDPAKGYYSFDLGAWHIISLNTGNCPSTTGGRCAAGSTQEQWLRAELAANRTDCTLAYWHHPRFSSGTHGSLGHSAAFWQALYEYEADVVLVGHEHSYERFAPQNPAGAADPKGIRQFVVGTGGTSLRSFPSVVPNSVARNNSAWGVLKLTLRASSYDWQFLPVAGASNSDAGSASCNTDSAPPPTEAPIATTGSASNVTASSATLSGTVDAGGEVTTARFEYGTSTSYGSTSTAQNIGGNDPVNVVATISGLAPGRLYHYRLVATSAKGTDLGSDRTFTTAAGPPPPPPPPPPEEDIDPPETTITAGPTGTVASSSARFEFTSDEPGSTFRCRLDGSDWSACSSPQDYSGLSARSHRFRVRATDPAGNPDGSPATRRWTVAASIPVEYMDLVLADGPAGYWRLGEPAGSATVIDSSANGLDGSYRDVEPGAPGALAGDPDTAAAFPGGSRNDVFVGDFADLNFGTGNFTVEAWVRTTARGERTIVAKFPGGSGHWAVSLTNDSGQNGHIRLRISDGDVTRHHYGPDVTVNDGAWHHVVVVVDRSFGTRIYVDGIEQATSGWVPGDVSNSAPLRIGDTSSHGGWDGELDEIAVYPTALSAARVRGHYEAGRPSLVAADDSGSGPGEHASQGGGEPAGADEGLQGGPSPPVVAVERYAR